MTMKMKMKIDHIDTTLKDLQSFTKYLRQTPVLM